MISNAITIAAIFAILATAGYALHIERTRSGLLLFSALIVTALLDLLDLLSLSLPSHAFFWKEYGLFAEGLLPSLWILASLTFARQLGPWKISLPTKVFIGATLLIPVLPRLLPLSSFFYAPDFPGEPILFLGDTGLFFYVAIMVSLIVALVNLEVTYVNASPSAKWKIKFELIGLGTILTVQVFYFSQALLYRSLNMNYLPLRSFMYLVATAMMTFSFIWRRGKARIQVSRQVAFKSFVLFAVGIYLVVVGLFDEGMRYLGIYFPRTVVISLVFLLGIVLLIMMLSEKVRREVKVVLHKNFYQQKHDYRTQWLSFTEQLSSSRTGDELLNHILSAYCEIFGIAGAALFQLEESRGGYFIQASFNIYLPDVMIAMDNSLISFMKKRLWVISVAEENTGITEEDVRYFKDAHISFVVPIFDGERLEGFIVLGRPVNSKEVYIYEDYDLMKTIARQASLAILHQSLSKQITHAREIEAIGNVATFIAHDLKNHVSNLSLIVENASRYLDNQDFQRDMLLSLGNTVAKMQKLINRLKNLGEQNYFSQQSINLLELAEKSAQLTTGHTITVSGTDEIVLADENEIQNVIQNLLMNAIEASNPDEPVEIEVGRDKVPFLRVVDHGCGITTHFKRTKLFAPFKTTKKQGLGIGLYQCRLIVEAHGGKIEVNSEEGKGSVFTVWFSGN